MSCCIKKCMQLPAFDMHSCTLANSFGNSVVYHGQQCMVCLKQIHSRANMNIKLGYIFHSYSHHLHRGNLRKRESTSKKEWIRYLHFLFLRIALMPRPMIRQKCWTCNEYCYRVGNDNGSSEEQRQINMETLNQD